MRIDKIFINELRQEAERMAQVSHKGKRLYNDNYIIKVFSLRYSISQERITQILTPVLQSTKETNQTPNYEKTNQEKR